MTATATTRPLDALKKLRNRSLEELLTRGSQTLAAYRDSLGPDPQLPSDEEFRVDVDATQFGRSPIIAESLWQKFFKSADTAFFPSFVGNIGENFRSAFDEHTCDFHVSRAEAILAGRINLLGYADLQIGADVDWHREPLSGTRSPMKHWKLFDELDTRDTGDPKIIWELNRHQHFFTLGLAYVLTDDERFTDAFARQLDSWIEQNPYGIGINWASSLEVSLRAISWIWALHLFRHSNALTMALFMKALKVLHLHARHIEKYLSKYYSPNTHLTGEALGLFYLGTQLPFLKRATKWRETGQTILTEEATKQFHKDGVYFEQSTWYQRYSVDFYIQFLQLQNCGAHGSSQSGETGERVSKALEFMMQVTRPDGTTPMIGDDDGGRILPLTSTISNDFRGTLAAGAAFFGRADLKFVAGNGSEEELFWLFGRQGLEEYRAMAQSEPAGLSRFFADGGYAVMRDGWTETDNFLLIDCGEVGALSGGHGHADALSIDAAVNGKTLLVDPGTYSYHASRTDRDSFRSTSAHNSIAMDGRSSSEPGGVFSWKTRAETTAAEFVSADRFDFFSGSHRGYSRIVDDCVHTRSVLFLRNDYWIIHDMITATGEHAYSLNFQYDEGIKVGPDIEGDFVGNADHRIFTFGEGSWTPDKGAVAKAYGRKSDADLMRYVVNGRGPQEFFTFLLPVDERSPHPEVSEVDLVGGRAFVVNFGGYNDVFVAGDTAVGANLATELFETDFRFTWARVPEGTTTPEEYVLISGRKFSVAGMDIISGVSRHRSASIRRVGNELYLNCDGDRSVKALPS